MRKWVMRPALNDAQAAPVAACSAIASLLPATAQIVAGRPGQVGEVVWSRKLLR